MNENGIWQKLIAAIHSNISKVYIKYLITFQERTVLALFPENMIGVALLCVATN
jgi:hypothetical protein